MKIEYTCPSCGKKHEVSDLNEGAEYDGLCAACEVEWVNSPEYSELLHALEKM